MNCYDASANVYYPQHQEYAGPDPKMMGRCCRCLEITDPEAAARGKAAQAQGDAEAKAVGYVHPFHLPAPGRGLRE